MNIIIPIFSSTTNINNETNDSTTLPSFKINQTYINAVLACGYNPVLLPMPDFKFTFDGNLPVYVKQYIEKYMDIANGVIFPGGPDLDQTLFQQHNIDSYDYSLNRDLFEMEIFKQACLKDLPIFGICRGFQLIGYYVINKHRKNTNIESVLSFRHHIENHKQSQCTSNRSNFAHYINCTDGFVLPMLSEGKAPVNSLHHQGIMALKGEEIFNKCSDIDQKKIKNNKLLSIKVFEDSHISFRNYNELMNNLFKYTETGKFTFSIIGSTTRGIKKESTTFLVEAFDLNLKHSFSKIRCVQWHPEEIEHHWYIIKTHFN